MRRAALFLLPDLTAGTGGIARVSRALIEATARIWPTAALGAVLGREPELVAPELLDDETRARLVVAGNGASLRALRIGTTVARAFALAARLRPTLIVCTHLNYAPLGRALAQAFGARLIVQAHGIEAWSPPSPALRWGLSGADLIVCVSHYTSTRLRAHLPPLRARFEVLHNPVDTARFTPGAAAPAVLAKLAALARPRLLTVARLDAAERYKGIDVVLRALAGPARALAASYLIVGDGSDRPRLEAEARALNVQAHFYGHADEAELVHLYRASDVFVMPSHGEGFGCVYAEAMASGLPVIAGGRDGSVDALGGGALGLLVDPLDPESVARALAAHLGAESPSTMRDPLWLHAQVQQRFGLATFERRVAAIIGAVTA